MNSVELLPVIEIDRSNQNLIDSLGALAPISSATNFYRAIELPLTSIQMLINIHLKEYVDGIIELEEICTLFGGYLLRVDGQNVLFPQCCGELGDIVYWKHVALYGREAYSNGHPCPIVHFSEDEVIFTCRDDYEAFQPPTAHQIRVNKTALADAYKRAVRELAILARNVQILQQELQLPVESLADVLIYHNPELPKEASLL